jgi:poly(A) polymerase
MTPRAAAESILEALRGRGHEAYLVGGCVRDLLLHREPKDYDITTNAHPEQVMELFPHTLAIGAAFGVVAVIHEGVQIEVATYRSDGKYPDGRHPEIVFYSETAEADVARRDFTMNGLLLRPYVEESIASTKEWGRRNGLGTVVQIYGHDGNSLIMDFVGGVQDINNKVIRAIGDPDNRFKEDALRMLRACRFSAQLGFEIKEKTLKAITKNSALIDKVSKERVAMELLKIVSSPFPLKGLIPLITTGLLNHIPLFHAIDYRLSWVLRRFAEFSTDDPVLGMTMLLAEAALISARTACNDLKLSNDQTSTIMGAMKVCDNLAKVRECFKEDADPTTMMAARTEIKRSMRTPGSSNALTLLKQDTVMGTLPPEMSKVISYIDTLGPEDISPPRLVTGKDLIAMGFAPGPDFRKVLDAIELFQLQGGVTDRETALDIAKRLAMTVLIEGTILGKNDGEEAS